jgi:predicted transposase YbfD/YdcC
MVSRASDAPGSVASEVDLSELLQILSEVPDRRDARGRIYGLPYILSVALIAILAGASKFRQIADHAADLQQEILGKLGGPWCWFQRRILVPSQSTIRLALAATDADKLDEIVGKWLSKYAPKEPNGELHLCVDGKVLRGVRRGENENFTLFSAFLEPAGVTVAQVAVPDGTSETTQVETLLKQVEPDEGHRVIVTLDAAHTARDTARYITEKRGFDYVMTVKGNRGHLQNAVFRETVGLTTRAPDHQAEEQGHGRIRRWSTWATDAKGISFPGARQAALIKREEFDLAKQRVSKEIALILTSQDTDTATAADIHNQVRKHWAIENKSHYVRDTVFHEDAHITYSKNGSRTMASLRNIAIGLLRIAGHSEIKRTTEWINRDRTRALHIMSPSVTTLNTASP